MRQMMNPVTLVALGGTPDDPPRRPGNDGGRIAIRLRQGTVSQSAQDNSTLIRLAEFG
jgi:hypothetical protein